MPLTNPFDKFLDESEELEETNPFNKFLTQDESSEQLSDNPFMKFVDEENTATGLQTWPTSLIQKGLNTVRDTGVSALKSVVGTGEAAMGIPDLLSGGYVGKGWSELGYDPKKTQEILSSLYSPEYQAKLKKLADSKGIIETAKTVVTNPSIITNAAVESLGPMFLGGAGARSIAAKGVTPVVAGAIGEGLITAGANAEQVRENTEDGLLTAKQVATQLAAGAITGAIGVAGGRVAQKLGVADPDTLLAQVGSNVTKKGVIKRIIGGGISEGVFEELPQSVQEQIWQNAALDKPLTEGVAQQGILGGIVGGVMGAGSNVLSGGAGETPKTDAYSKTYSDFKQAYDEGKFDKAKLENFITQIPKDSTEYKAASDLLNSIKVQTEPVDILKTSVKPEPQPVQEEAPIDLGKPLTETEVQRVQDQQTGKIAPRGLQTTQLANKPVSESEILLGSDMTTQQFRGISAPTTGIDNAIAQAQERTNQIKRDQSINQSLAGKEGLSTRLLQEEQQNAAQEGSQQENVQSERQGVNEFRQAAETGGGNSLQSTKINPEDKYTGNSFLTSKGSSYEILKDGTTIRNKAARKEHPGEEGQQPQSKKTWYVTEEDAIKLAEVQAEGGDRATVAELGDGRVGVKYLTGKDKGKFEKRTVITPKNNPEIGLMPVEYFGDNKTIHFGNKIKEINLNGKETQKRLLTSELGVQPEAKSFQAQQAEAKGEEKQPVSWPDQNENVQNLISNAKKHGVLKPSDEHTFKKLAEAISSIDGNNEVKIEAIAEALQMVGPGSWKNQTVETYKRAEQIYNKADIPTPDDFKKSKKEATETVKPEPQEKQKQTIGTVRLDKGGVKYFNDFREIKKGVKKGQYVVTLTNGNKVNIRKEQVKSWPTAAPQEEPALAQTEPSQSEKENVSRSTNPGITVTGDKEKTVSIDMPTKAANKLSYKEQKQYLLDEIDKALESAPDVKVEKIPESSTWERDREMQPEAVSKASASEALSDWVKDKLSKGEKISWQDLFTNADIAFDGTQADGVYSSKDAYDAMELGINQYIEAQKFNPTVDEAWKAIENIGGLKYKIIELIPTQTKRNAEMDEFQQYSTPPPYAYAVAWAAKISKDDVVVEPSAGTGNIAIMAKNAGAAKVIVNELSDKRSELLKALDFDEIYHEDAAQLNNILPASVKPTVILMNPPFSSTAGRMKGVRKTSEGANHIEQALKRLEPNGRLVAIVGEGMADNKPAFKTWWDRIKKEYNVRANIGVSGREYAKYGTTFDNQILIIDKTGKTDYNNIITGQVDRIENLIPLIEGIRNDRREQGINQPSVTRGPQKSGVKKSGTGQSVLPATGDVGVQVGQNNAQPENVGTEGKPGKDVGGVEAIESVGTPDNVQRGEGEVRPRKQRPLRPGRRDIGTTGQQTDGESSGVSADTVDQLQITSSKKESSEQSDDIHLYSGYKPERLTIEGSKPHPTKLVQSAAMAAVNPPAPAYTPSIPKKVITDGKLSDIQLEAIVYAGQAHEQVLPNGMRKGFFIGDGTGVGKGREISGIFMDNWNKGRKKGIWLSDKAPLVNDARRDVKGLGWEDKKIINGSLIKTSQKDKSGKVPPVSIPVTEGILFFSYDTLKGGPQDENLPSRIDQIVEWFGKDFDGVIAFDESHNMGNAISVKGKRGRTKPAQKALAGIELQKRLPNARVIYVSATGATEVMNLAYAERLGLWGEGTPFADAISFISEISSGGMASMELVSQDMKAMGSYMARALSYDGVETETLEHPLNADQREDYNKLAEGWQIILRNINEALQLTGAVDAEGHTLNSKAKVATMSKFWGSHQRFFNQIITSMQTPAAIQRMRKDIEKGESVVIQLTNTMEASQERALSALAEEDTLEDLDLTPRDSMLEYLKNSFPVTQYEEYVDDNENVKSRPVTDSQGNIVQNPEAVAMRDNLLRELASIRTPDSPLDMIISAFGTKNVAEITGRKRRVVRNDKGERVIENRSEAKGIAEINEYMDDKRKVLIFSEKGGTGRSYHADLDARNKRKRNHYLLQPGWRADKAIQGLGRTHRSNEAQPPKYILCTTDLKGQKRFLSSIARRLGQLGALTKGQRQTGGQGILDESFNLENQYAIDALNSLFRDIRKGNIEGISLNEFQDQTGLKLIDDRDGNPIEQNPDIRQFLNRLLSLNIDTMNKVFDAFSTRLETIIQYHKDKGDLDQGLETLKALKIDVAQEEKVYEDKKSGSETNYVTLDVTDKTVKIPFLKVNAQGFFVNAKSGKIWAYKGQHDRTDPDTGRIYSEAILTSVTGTRHYVENYKLRDTNSYEEKKTDEAKDLWDTEYKNVPETHVVQKHLITGTLLPIWDRITGEPRIMRIVTSNGRQMIGRLISGKDLDSTLKNLGVGARKIKDTPSQVIDKLMRGARVELANGWALQKRKVSGDDRIELKGPNYRDYNSYLKKYGVFDEQIQWQVRYFMPKDAEVLAKIINNSPIVDIVDMDAPVFLTEKDIPIKAPAGHSLLSVRGVETIVRDFQKQFPNSGEIRVVETQRDLPDLFKAFLHEGDRVFAAYDPKADITYVVASNMKDRAAINKALVHEVIRHRGVFNVLNAEEKTQVFNLVHEAYKDTDLGRQVIRAYGLDLENPKDQRTFGKEMIAHVEADKPSLWDKIVAIIKKALRRVFPNVSFSDAEMRALIGQAKEFSRKGAGDAGVEVETAYSQTAKQEPFYSQLLRTVQDKFNDMPGKVASVIPWLQKNQVKPMEIEEMGVEKWIKDNARDGKIDKVAFRKFVEDNQVQIQEVVKGDELKWKPAVPAKYKVGDGIIISKTDEGFKIKELPSGEYELINRAGEVISVHSSPIKAQSAAKKIDTTKFSNWKLPGGSNYKEVLFTLPNDNTLLKNKFNEYKNEYPENGYKTPRDARLSSLYLDLKKSQKFDEQELLRISELMRFPFNTAIKQLESEGWNPELFHSSHWSEPNVLAHARMQDFMDAEGNKVLLVEEVQSDWHQKGKKEGYAKNAALEKAQKNLDDYEKNIFAKYDKKRTETEKSKDLNIGIYVKDIELLIGKYATDEESAKYYSLKKAVEKEQGIVPNAPLKENWPEWVMKRMLRYAAENGYDKIAWTTGEQQAERYDLSKHLDNIYYNRFTDGSEETKIVAYDKKGQVVINETYKNNKLEDVIGKDLAKKILEGDNQRGELSGLDLKVGGVGMKKFYDEKLVNFMNKYVKRWGGKVETTGIQTVPNKSDMRDISFNETGEGEYINPASVTTVHSVTLAPEMSDAVLYEGQPMYQKDRNLEAAADDWLQNYMAAKKNPKVQAEVKEIEKIEKEGPENLSTLQKIFSKNESIISIRNTKPNFKWYDTVLGTPLHYYKKIPAAWRLFRDANKKTDISEVIKNALLMGPDGKTFDTTVMKDLQKQSPKDYKSLQESVVEDDRNQYGYRVLQDGENFLIWEPGEVKMPNTFSSYSDAVQFMTGVVKAKKLPIDLVRYAHDPNTKKWTAWIPKNTKPVASFNSESAAWADVRQRQAKDFQKKYNTSDEAANAYIAHKRILDKGFDLQMKTLRDMIHFYASRGLKLPEVVEVVEGERITVNLKKALAMMGDRRSYYFPRNRKQGRYMVIAEQKGLSPEVHFFDLALEEKTDGDISRIKKAINAATPLGRKLRKLRAKGFNDKNINVEISNRTIEDVFVNGVNRIIEMQTEINNALRATDAEPINLEKLGLRHIDRRVSVHGTMQRDFAVTGPTNKEQRKVLKEMGGQWYSPTAGEPKAWHFTNPGRGFEKKLAKALSSTSHVVDQEAMTMFAQAFMENLADIEKGRGARSHMIARSNRRGKDVFRGYEEDPLIADSTYAAGLAGGEAKKIMALNLVKDFNGTDISFKQFDLIKKYKGSFDDYEIDKQAAKAATSFDGLKKLNPDTNIDNEDDFYSLRELDDADIEREDFDAYNSPEAYQENADTIESLKKADNQEGLSEAITWIHDEYLKAVEDRGIIGTNKQDRAWKDCKDYISNMLRNDDQVDRIMGTIKGIAVFKYLGLRVSSMAVNATNMMTAVPGAMNVKGGIPLHSTARLIADASNKYTRYKLGKAYQSMQGISPSLSADEEWAMGEILTKKWDGAKFNREALAALESKWGRRWSNVVDFSMAGFGAVESLNRGATILGSFNGIRKAHPEMTKEDALKLAKEVSDYGNSVYNKANWPSWTRGSGIGANIARSAYLFGSYTHNYLQLMKAAYGPGFIRIPQNKAALGWLTVAPAILGGTGAMVGWEIISKLLQMFGIGGDDPEEEFYAWVADHFGDYGEQVARYGSGGALGVNIKGSLSIGNNTNFDLTNITLGDILGAPYDMLVDQPVQFVNAIKAGNTLKAIENTPIIMPMAASNMVKGYRESTQGVTTTSNTPVFYGNEPVMADKGDVIARFLSFSPADIAGKREKQYSEKQVEKRYSEEKSEIYDRFRAYFGKDKESRTKKEWMNLLEDVREYNERLKNSKVINKVYINNKSIRTNMKRSFTPSKKEKIRAGQE